MSGAVLFDRNTWGKVELAGPEARSFLHNLCTNDVKNLPVGAGCEAFLTTAKARVVSHFFVGHFDAGAESVLWLDTVPGQSEKLVQTLNHYLISEQVELADRTKDLGLFTLAGPTSLDIIKTVFRESLSDLKALHHRKVRLDGADVFLRCQAILNVPGVDLIFSAASADSILHKLQGAGVGPGDQGTFESLRIEAGFPLYGPDIDDNRLVMEIGRAAQAISYAKGCFLGQEPIVMARDRGQVNRTLLGVKVDEGEPLPTGTKLFKDDVEAGQTTSSVRSPRLDQVIALAYLRRGYQDPGMELSTEPARPGRKAFVSPLPFV
ncbi:MAG: aminomethyl transferase family protein [Planctomycetes bacterium]|nr:aminomethyl transferase family protein [Planctomycetota bacterium]